MEAVERIVHIHPRILVVEIEAELWEEVVVLLRILAVVARVVLRRTEIVVVEVVVGHRIAVVEEVVARRIVVGMEEELRSCFEGRKPG